MLPEGRRAIAFIAAKAMGRPRGATVYDYDAGAHFHFSGNVGSRVSIYDHDAHAHITGSLQSLYHHGFGNHIRLKIDGGKFTGFDFGTGSHFQGTVRQQNVQFYDFQTGRFFHYLVT